MKSYEKLGAFYLGRSYDLDQRRVGEETLLYDAKDLTTHAVCVGMTGSGKTGLCVGLLEEAALDGIPAIAIDPKGDLGNLLLTFPELRARDFRPWIDPGEAARKGHTPDEHARATAETWRKGLAQWDQDGERIARFKAAVDAVIYTPGSSAGLPLTLLRSFAAPPPALARDADALRERVMGAVSGLLALVGGNADPVRSREHILLSALLERAWREGRDLDLAALIRGVQSPPFERLGVLEIDSFFPSSQRFELAMALNNLLASPAFSAWSQGEALDVGRLFYTAEGRPRLSVLSIAHLSEAERMFFVTLLLNEVVTWMRAQPGTNSLRALLYMDEVFGYFPPTANPPSKRPMLTLLKQARAYGLGVVLATQNPVDLDYKGLSNTGTWFLGRLQTERDKARVIEGLEGASAEAGARFDRAKLERTLAGLSSRVFLVNNVHEDEPTLFHTRWAMSYLRGPLTRDQIAQLMAPRLKQAAAEDAARQADAAPERAQPAPAELQTEAPGNAERPVVPPKIDECFVPLDAGAPDGGALVYRPSLLGVATLHYTKAGTQIDNWETVTLLAPLGSDATSSPWKQAALRTGGIAVDDEAEEGARFATLPSAAARTTSYTRWTKMLKSHLYRSRPLRVWRYRELKAMSRPGQSEGEFRVEVSQLLREHRDLQIEKLRKRYAPKLATLRRRRQTAEERVSREESQYKAQKLQTAVSLGATVLGALFGRKLGSVGNVGRATTTVRGASRAARERDDIGRAEEKLELVAEQEQKLAAEFDAELERLQAEPDESEIECEPLDIAPRKSDLAVERLALAWTPWRVYSDGNAEPAHEVAGEEAS